VSTPTIDVVLALAKQMGRVANVYPTFPETVFEDEPAGVSVD
jgi:2-dehydropantoate 2-reductase